MDDPGGYPGDRYRHPTGGIAPDSPYGSEHSDPPAVMDALADGPKAQGDLSPAFGTQVSFTTRVVNGVAQSTAQRWQPIDLTDRTDAARYEGDPGDLIDAGAVLLALASKPAWMADAACREHPELNWFPGQGGDTSAPKAVCADCLVQAECEEFALDQGSWLSGIWAGYSERQRRQLRRASHDEAA